MAQQPKKRLGKGAKVSILIKYLHPSRLVSSTFPNVPSTHQIDNCTVVGRDTTTVNCKKDRPVIIIQHELFKSTDGEDEEIYALPRWFKITEEGPSEHLFGASSSTEVTNPMNNGIVSTEQVEAPSIVNMINERGRIIHNDLANLNGQVDIDDDNETVPENIPSPADNENDPIFSYDWDHDGVCSRRQVRGFNAQLKLFNFGGFDVIPTLLQTFELKFLHELIKSVIIKETNKHLEKNITYMVNFYHQLDYGFLWLQLHLVTVGSSGLQRLLMPLKELPTDSMFS